MENLKQSKLGQIPNLSGSGNYSYSWGRALDQTTYRYTDEQIGSFNFGLNSYTNLFNGLQVRNTIQQNELNLMASYEDVQKVKNDITLNIAAAYLSIMFNRELLAVTEIQLETTGQQVERTKKMVDAGKVARGNFLGMNGNYAAGIPHPQRTALRGWPLLWPSSRPFLPRVAMPFNSMSLT